LRTESIASSKVEGLQVDARDLARAEARSDLGRRPGTTAAEILGNVDAMHSLSTEAASVTGFDSQRIVAIHEALMRVAPNSSIAGKVRTVQNWIGGNDYNPCGAAFVPPPPEDVDRLLIDLCAAVDEETLPPLVQVAVLHAQIETIHPFEDGNDCTGRALVQVILRRRALSPSSVPPISVVLAKQRNRYIEGLTVFREGDIAGWVEQFSVATAQATELASRYLDEVRALQERWRDQLRAGPNPRSDAAAWALIDVLPAHPVLTVAVGVVATGRTKPAVNQAVVQLEESGVLEPLTTSERNRAWEATRLLDLLASLEAGEVPD
jgi:Fic family protein